ncbi:hypothetical protein T484DRAFT_1758477, partial [Baffinella frigidus]
MKEMCESINFLVEIFYLQVFCSIKNGIAGAIQSIIDALWPIPVDFLVSFVEELNAISCDPKNFLTACTRAIDDDPAPIPRIDAATRCWSTYVNSLGDASSLSCSAADSCIQYEPGSNKDKEGTGLVACDDCQILTDLPDFQRYGCDIVRKQCKCAVQAISHTACINHAQCQSPDSTCDLLDNAFSPTSFGTQPCDTCAQGNAMCIHAPGGARCACPTRGESLQTCRSTSISKFVAPDLNALCLITLGGSTSLSASHSTQYALQYDDLAAAPCSIIKQPFCYSVFRSSWKSATFIVGLGVLNVRRRLLESDEDVGRRLLQNHDEDVAEEEAWKFLGPTIAGVIHIAPHDLERVAARPWDTVVDEGCRLVGPIGLLVSETNISVSDRILYKQCVRWRAIGDDVRRTFNLTVPDTFLLSMQDLAAALYDPSVILGFLRHPEIF